MFYKWKRPWDPNGAQGEDEDEQSSVGALRVCAQKSQQVAVNQLLQRGFASPVLDVELLAMSLARPEASTLLWAGRRLRT